MTKLKLFNPNQFKSFPKIPSGNYPFVITDWDHTPEKSVVTVTIETPTGIELDEAFHLRKRDGTLNYMGYKNLFALMEVALNRELSEVTEQEFEEALGKYFRADLVYSRGKDKIFVNLDPDSYETDNGAAFKTNSSHCTWDWVVDEY